MRARRAHRRPSPVPGPGLALGLAAISTAVACGERGAPPLAGGGVRDTLPGGIPVVRYTDLADRDEAPIIIADLRIGSVDGDGPDVFGDVRGIEVDSSGAIYVLDYQAADVRVFSAEGDHLRTLSRRGEGPGELGNANGMVLAGDTLFIYDHSKWVMMGLSPTTGAEVVRHDTPVRSYSYLWQGTRDDRGRFWKPTNHSDEPVSGPPEVGLQEGTSRAYLKVLDPATETADSVFMGEQGYQSWVTLFGSSGFSMRSIPFQSGVEVEVDPAGGFWQVATGAYRIARLNADGDTTLVITADIAPLPVTDADRDAFAAPLAERSPDGARVARDILEHAPDRHPVVKSVFVGEGGLLWVERTAAEGEGALYDVFTRGGVYRGSLQLGFDASPFFEPRIRDGRLYTLVQDELDVPFVVGAPLPAWATEE